MWCRGIPGSGKTVLASLVIDSLREPELTQTYTGLERACSVVAGIYCSYKSPQLIANMLSSLLQQLLLPLDSIPDSCQVDTTSKTFQSL